MIFKALQSGIISHEEEDQISQNWNKIDPWQNQDLKEVIY